MRSTMRQVLGMLLVVLGISFPASAGFHLMQIEQVIGGVNGDVTAQAIQLRMRTSGQNFTGGARLRAWDANGMNPVVVFTFSGNVVNGMAGARILIASNTFVAATTPPTIRDFNLTTPIPAAYLAAGKLTFESSAGIIYWAVSWGGYTGPNTGNAANDPDGQFSPAFSLPLPTTDASALQFPGAFSAQSSNNAADYVITSGTSTWGNNSGGTFQLGSLPPSGRCCLPGEVCSVLTETACGVAGGTWTANESCPEGACTVSVVGACCEGSTCSVTTSINCGMLGGTFRGSGTTCAEGAPNNFIECCRANFDEENGLGVPDIFAFLSAWFAQDPRADFDGTAGIQVPDIFAFLSLWFAGCS